MAEGVLLTYSLFNFFFLLAWAKVHISIKRCQLVESESTEGLITLYATQCIFSEGADWHNLALALNRFNDITESLLFGNSIGGQL